MSTWVLILALHSNGPIEEMVKSRKEIIVEGFSTKEDCEKAGEAAGDVFMLREGKLRNLIIDCKMSN